MESVREVLAGNRYPGRGVLWGRGLDGGVYGVYFLTGRSAASRARGLRLGGGELVVSPTDTTAHDPLRHYAAARQEGRWLTYGNGEQVAVVAERLRGGAEPGPALQGLEYEPDPPIFTPRITVVADRESGEAWFGAARRSRGGRESTDVLTLRVGELAPGDAVLMTTYRSDGETVATAEPYHEVAVTVRGKEELLAEVWGALTPELRVAIAVFESGKLADAVLRHA
ncbi:IMP cyclohydrolase [Kitasatospora sp. NPDC002227]|uniref:IMP cyclohydrolase n=1 Tax=Kitasatospora sp. NPDC002227 TaxID=3154773 RepID=UPI0033310321